MRLASVALVVVGAAACGSEGASSAGAGGEGGIPRAGGGGAHEGAGGSANGGAPDGGAGGAGAEGGYAPGEPDCHPREESSAHGAYFRKVTSGASSSYLTLHTTGSLPRVIIDTDRWFSTDDPSLAYQNGPLDRPSFYLGGRASGVEVDAGLTWDRVYDGDGRPTESFAFRPFWRAAGVWANPALGSEDNVYFDPGEHFRMQLKSTSIDILELTINSDDDPSKTFRVTFDAPGWGRGEAQLFKRVHSIDQFTVIDGERVGLETADLDVLPTRTILEDATWSTVRVLGEGGVELAVLDCDAPAVVGSDAVLDEGYDAIFLLYDQTPNGGERSVIVPSAVPALDP